MLLSITYGNIVGFAAMHLALIEIADYISTFWINLAFSISFVATVIIEELTFNLRHGFVRTSPVVVYFDYLNLIVLVSVTIVYYVNLLSIQNIFLGV